jgi:CRISPR/Cas system endoribonuclease Cas6 (RAMP superfamily)
MSLTPINTADLEQLQQFRIQRFVCFFANNLQYCPVLVNADNTLAIYCPDAEFIDELLDELEDLRHYAYIILGVHEIILYLAHSKEILASSL